MYYSVYSTTTVANAAALNFCLGEKAERAPSISGGGNPIHQGDLLRLANSGSPAFELICLGAWGEHVPLIFEKKKKHTNMLRKKLTAHCVIAMGGTHLRRYFQKRKSPVCKSLGK